MGMRSWTSMCGLADPWIRVMNKAVSMTRSSESCNRFTFPQLTSSRKSIIAVQGLGANPYYTWVKKVPRKGDSTIVEEVMWLRDLLPSHVRNARIATFSYLSGWYTFRKGVKTTLRELGERLLNALQLNRQKLNVSVQFQLKSTWRALMAKLRQLVDQSSSLAIAWVAWSSNRFANPLTFLLGL